MDVKIKNNEELIDATVEMVDGVMVVSPKEVKLDPKDGDVVTITDNQRRYTVIYKHSLKSPAFAFHSAICPNDDLLIKGSISTMWHKRYATEEEKQKLFAKMKEKGYEWDAEKKEVVEIKWKPEVGEVFHFPIFSDYIGGFVTDFQHNDGTIFNSIKRGWCFKTEAECKSFCDKLNKAIESIKP